MDAGKSMVVPWEHFLNFKHMFISDWSVGFKHDFHVFHSFWDDIEIDYIIVFELFLNSFKPPIKYVFLAQRIQFQLEAISL